jgi:uncharacterized protein (TIGR03437 family)
MNRSRTWISLGFVVAATIHGQQYLDVGPFGYAVTGSVYGDGSSMTSIFVQGRDQNGNPANVKFTCNTAVPNLTLLLFSPCSGTTPQQVLIFLNLTVVPTSSPGKTTQEVLFNTVDQSPPRSAFAFVDVTITLPPPPGIGAVVSAASLQPAISPGEIVSIFGSSLGPPVLSSQPLNGVYPTFFGYTTVTFNGAPAPTLFNNTSQINAIVPYAIAGQKTAQVVVSHYGQASTAFSVPIADTSPGIFTLTQDGRGQGAILNDGATVTINGPINPARRGSAITIFATGAGMWNQPVLDGQVLINVLQSAIAPQAPVALTIGGQPAQILYAGAAPYMVSGVLQVNAIVPQGVASGSQPAILMVGQADNSKQSVTVAIE